MIETEVKELELQHASLLRWLTEVKVTSDEEQKQAEDLLIKSRRALKQATDKRMELTRPLDESKRKIIEFFQPHIDRLTTGISIINTELRRWRDKKQLEAEIARLDALENIKPITECSTVSEPEKTSKTESGSVTYRDDYDIKIINPDLVPRDLCEPSMPRIRAKVKSGVLIIPGVEITPKYVTVTRT